MARQADKHIQEYRKIEYALCVSPVTRTLLTGKILICLGKKPVYTKLKQKTE